MARKYTRDNRGRFASSGSGATARGGRLRTASGNKRATQTMKAAGASGSGVMKGRAARTVAGEKAMGKLAKRPVTAAMPRQKAKLPRMATPSGAIRKSDLAKVKQDAKTGIGTPVSRAAQRSISRSAREAPLQRRDAIQAAKRQGKTGFGGGPAMNAKAISSREFAWNKNETPASPSQRLSMWRKSERRMRRASAQQGAGKGLSRSGAGEMRASRMAARDVDLGTRRGSLPTTRRMAELPRQRRMARIARNEAQGRLNAAFASQKVLPKVNKLRQSVAGKKATTAQKARERQLVSEYNKLARKLSVAQAAKSYAQNPYGFTPTKMSGRK